MGTRKLPIEPHKIEKEWGHRGLRCAVTMTRQGGNRCGYVCVPRSHPIHGYRWHDDQDNMRDPLEMQERRVLIALNAFFTEPEPNGSGWWFGFSHGGACDPTLDPATLSEEDRNQYEMLAWSRRQGEHYWTVDEVVAECERLADRLARMGEDARNEFR